MGNYMMERGWMEHPLFADEAFSRAQAFEWMISEAAWKEGRKRINGKIITLKRGQFSHSIRFMADKWKWHRARVDRFLKELRFETVIETSSETGQLVITVCNYKKYQLKPSDLETDDDTQFETRARQQRDTSETKKNTFNTNIEDKSASAKKRFKASEFILPDWMPKDLWDDFLAMRAKLRAVNSDKALSLLVQKIEKLKMQGHDPTALIEAAILNSWKSVYEPKENHNAANRTGNRQGHGRHQPTKTERLIEAAKRAHAGTGFVFDAVPQSAGRDDAHADAVLPVA
jgi:DNA-binding transcriptional regulator YhcF (GntR family)